MVDREKIKMGMMELMAMRTEEVEKAVKDPVEFPKALKEYEQARAVVIKLDVDVSEYDKRRNKSREDYGNAHSGVML